MTLSRNIDKVLDEVRILPSLPALLMEIIESMNNDQIKVSEFGSKISQDQALVARVMRVANSPFFGFSSRIRSIEQAITILGFNTLRGLVIAAGVIKAFEMIPEQFDQAGFWRHSISTGVWARLLAKHAGLNEGIAFIAGLLHDIGTLVLVINFPDGFSRVQQLVMEGMGLLAAEAQIFGLDHPMIGAKLVSHWNFPLEISQAISHHHDPVKSGLETILQDVIYSANLLSHQTLIEDDRAYCVEEARTRMGLHNDALAALTKEAERILEGALILMKG